MPPKAMVPPRAPSDTMFMGISSVANLANKVQDISEALTRVGLDKVGSELTIIAAQMRNASVLMRRSYVDSRGNGK